MKGGVGRVHISVCTLFTSSYLSWDLIKSLVLIGQRWNSMTLLGPTKAKAILLYKSDDQERRYEERRWLDTVVFHIVNYVDSELEVSKIW